MIESTGNVSCVNSRFASCQAENRAEFAERSVTKLEKSIDDLEGTKNTNFHVLDCFFFNGRVATQLLVQRMELYSKTANYKLKATKYGVLL